MNELIETHGRLVDLAFEKRLLSRNWYEHFKNKTIQTDEELEVSALELVHALIHSDYYITLERIEKGEEMLSKESDDKKKSEYRKLLNDLYIKLESLRPKGESA